MRRFLERLFTLCATMSLLLCIALVSLRTWGGMRMVQGWYVRPPELDERSAYFVEAASYSGTFSFTLTRNHLGPTFVGVRPDAALNEFDLGNPPGFRWSVYPAPDPPLGPPSGPTVEVFLSPRDAGFRARHYSDVSARGSRYDSWILAVPPWLPTALLLVLPVLWLYRFRKSRRAKRLGLCPACGYDLRASPDRCPECGMVADEKVAA